MASKAFSSGDAFGNNVSCSSKRWKHITDKRPELKDFQGLIINAIREPDFVCRSRSWPNRYVFYKSCILAIFKKYEQYLRIVIQYEGNLQDLVEGRTEDNFNGGIITVIPVTGTQLGEVMICRRQPV